MSVESHTLSFAAGLCGVPHIHTAWKPVFVLSTCVHESDFLFGCFLLKMVSLTLSVPSFFFSFSQSMSPFLSFSLSLAQYDVIMPVYSDDVMAADNFQMCERDFFPLHSEESCLKQPNNLRMKSVSLWIQTVSAVCSGPTSCSVFQKVRLQSDTQCVLPGHSHLVITVRLPGNQLFNATAK